jgi:hypothetical protein
MMGGIQWCGPALLGQSIIDDSAAQGSNDTLRLARATTLLKAI